MCGQHAPTRIPTTPFRGSHQNQASNHANHVTISTNTPLQSIHPEYQPSETNTTSYLFDGLHCLPTQPSSGRVSNKRETTANETTKKKPKSNSRGGKKTGAREIRNPSRSEHYSDGDEVVNEAGNNGCQSKQTQPEALWSCPICVAEPFRNHKHLSKEFRRFSDMTQHMSRHHALDYNNSHCPKCRTQLESEAFRDAHMKICTTESEVKPIYTAELQGFLKKLPSYLTSAEKWYKIWDRYVDSPLCRRPPYADREPGPTFTLRITQRYVEVRLATALPDLLIHFLSIQVHGADVSSLIQHLAHEICLGHSYISNSGQIAGNNDQFIPQNIDPNLSHGGAANLGLHQPLSQGSLSNFSSSFNIKEIFTSENYDPISHIRTLNSVGPNPQALLGSSPPMMDWPVSGHLAGAILPANTYFNTPTASHQGRPGATMSIATTHDGITGGWVMAVQPTQQGLATHSDFVPDPIPGPSMETDGRTFNQQ